MKTTAMLLMIAASCLLVAVESSFAQEKMSRDEWQTEMRNTTTRISSLGKESKDLDSQKTVLQSQMAKLDADVKSCEDALYAMLGVTRADVQAFDKDLNDMEKRVGELQRMTDAELVGYKDEINRMNERLKEMAASKIALIPRYGDRVHSLQDKVAALMKSLSKEKSYTVGTWSRDRDCLWNIAKKKDIYDNAWMWPKIWQGNRDLIKDPDVIKPRWVLKIPEGKELSRDEKSAANRYYRKKATGPTSQ
jgi:predicted RNase H-like nuclease (RuvC/YqgF family)